MNTATVQQVVPLAGWPVSAAGVESRWTEVLTSAMAAARHDPVAAWRNTVAIAGSAVIRLMPGVTADGSSVVAGLYEFRTGRSEPVWPLDADPAPADLVVLARRSDSNSDPQLRCFRADQLDLRDSPHAPGTRLWGGTEVVLQGTEKPIALVESSTSAATGTNTGTGPAARIGPDAALLMLAGAHALGVAGRYRAAFVAKAAVTNRGWASGSMLEDPTALKSLLLADNSITAATILLLRRGQEIDSAGSGSPVVTPAEVSAAGLHGLDSARAAVNLLSSLTGASALYDGSPLQEAVLHLNALGQHGMFARASRLRIARALTGIHPGVQPEEKP